MKKTYLLDNETVKIVKDLEVSHQVNGKTVLMPLIDKDGHWFQVEFMTGPNRGMRKPAAQHFLQ